MTTNTAPVQLRCDACQSLFFPRVVDKPLKGGAMVRQFRCPNCKQIYVVARYTAAGVALLGQIAMLDPAAPDYTERNAALVELLKSEIGGRDETS